MGLKLSGLDPHDVEYVGASNQDLKSPQAKLKLSDFSPEDVEHVEDPVDPATSPLTALTTGLIQGAVPFASAIGGVGKTAMDAITGTRGPLAGEGVSDLVKDYRDSRDQFSHDARTASEANPVTSTALNLVGGAVNPLFKGAGGIAGSVGGAALQGLGMSDADLTQGDVKNAAEDAALGGAGGAIGHGISRVIPKIMSGGNSLGKKALTILGPSDEAIRARFAGRAQSNAPTYPELAEDMGESLKKLTQQISDASKEAAVTLSQEPSIPKEYATLPIEDAINKMRIQGKIIGGSDKRAESVLNSLKDDIHELPDQLSQADLKKVIQSVDKNINWGDQGEDRLNTLLEGVRTGLDETLKFQNPQYKKAMEPVSDRMVLLKDIKKQFNFRNVPGEGLQPTDTTASKIKSARTDNNRAVTLGDLADFKNYVGKDYNDLANDYRLSQQFEKTAPNGSRRTLLGGALGGFLGHVAIPGAGGYGAGAALGTISGAMADRYGGHVAGNIIDSLVRAGKSKAFGKFAPILEQAAARGPQALSVTGSILSTNPEFKKILEGLSGQ